ncbi:hypothetical protein [Planomonospora parontospora]|uniref:hypothetical protein n=1 Tax=Planomonospora parontospora TaxID=58119 RepID=UPI001670A59F|nr:hypothetical protein [Planomonospora parontospora]GGL42889.1 hypothetical protein GCM10014719_50290 [Planomonospora parontospora subsp. antibiotica]GII18549.1 hypothetical protein Ppa05_52750 [Planomonospora parontospora subsp. antibiotica]
MSNGADAPIWWLRRRDETVGEIHVNDSDFPWLHGRFTPLPGFAAVAPLFAEDLALVEADDDFDGDAWEDVYERINGQLTLVNPAGKPVAEFILHIDGEQAWFRWID